MGHRERSSRAWPAAATLMLFAGLAGTVLANDLVLNSGFEPGETSPPPPPFVLINEIDADQFGTDTLEFVELFDGGAGNTSLDGLTLVFFNGADDASVPAAPFTEGIDLDGFSTDANGYFVIGNAAVPGVDIVINDNSIQNGAEAVALFTADGVDFPNDTPVTTTGIVSAVVFSTGQRMDDGLLPLLLPDQPQVDEGRGGDARELAGARCPYRASDARVTRGFTALPPTPGADNGCPATSPATPGTVAITEIMANPDAVNDSEGEWFELTNLALFPVDLAGCQLSDNSQLVVLEAPAVIYPGQPYVVARSINPTLNGDLPYVDTVAQPLGLNNGGETINLVCGGQTLDSVTYSGTTAGASLSLRPDRYDPAFNDDPANFCTAYTPFGAGDRGTPGFINVCAVAPLAGEVFFSEFMANPAAASDTTGEWIEIYNPQAVPIELGGCTLADNAGAHEISALEIDNQSHVILALSSSSANNGNLQQVDYVYDDVALSNGGDQLSLTCNEVLVDETAYTTTLSGRSRKLSLDRYDAASNDNEANWCDGTLPYGDGDLGSPRAFNTICP